MPLLVVIVIRLRTIPPVLPILYAAASHAEKSGIEYVPGHTLFYCYAIVSA